jgi:TPR repeat protein
MTTGRPFFRLMTTLTLVVAAAFLLASCGSSGNARKRDSNGNLVPSERELDPAGTLYSDMVDAADKGDCSPATVSALTCFAYRGHGYEGAQATLGQCLIHTGKTADGITWMKRAADAGWPDAQKSLAGIYMNGKGLPQSNVEAGFWINLYSKNPSLLSLGVQPDMTLAQRVRETLSADEKAEARRRSDSWLPAYWQPTDQLDAKTAATCHVRAKNFPTHEIPDIGQKKENPY